MAETLRKLGEQAGGDMSALHSDLRYIITMLLSPYVIVLNDTCLYEQFKKWSNFKKKRLIALNGEDCFAIAVKFVYLIGTC